MAQFYFINKDENSIHLSRSQPSEQAAIQRYVQTGRKRPRASKKLALHLAPTQQRKQNGPCNKHSNADCLWEDAPVLSPLVYGLAKQDPFNASSISLDSTVSGLLYYYVYYYHPSLWPNEMAVLKAGVYTFHQAVKSILQTVVANQTMMYCLLSAASCRMRYIDRLPSEAVSKKEEHYISNALRLMSQNIAQIELRNALTCIIFMISADSYRSEFAAAKVHLLAAHRLLEPLGGLAAIDDEFLTGQLAMGDLFLACVRLEPCIFDCQYDPGPASTLGLSSTEVSSFRPIAPELVRGGPLKEPILQLTEAYSVRSRLRIPSMTASRAMQASRWITKRCMAVRHRLLGLQLSGGDDAIRITLIMWSLLSMNVTGRTKTVKVMASGLQSAILEADFWPDADLKEWAFIVGSQCAPENSTTAKWFACQLFGLYRQNLERKAMREPKSQLKDLTDMLIAFQQRYLYDETVQRPRTNNLAALLLAMRT